MSRDNPDSALSDVAQTDGISNAHRDDAFAALLLNSTSEAFYAVDRDGATTHCNDAFLRMLGFPHRAAVLGHKLHDVIHHSHPDGTQYPKGECPIYHAASSGLPATVDDELFFRTDGTAFPVEYRAEPIWQAGELRGAICTFSDITARQASARSLADQARLLETLNRTGAAIAAELDLERLVQMVTDAGVELTGAQFGAFFYAAPDGDTESFMLFTLSGADRADFERFGMPRTTEVFKPTFLGTGVVRSDDITLDGRYGRNAPLRGMPEGHLPVRSYLAVPVLSRSGGVIGGLLFGHGEICRFTEAHERLMTGLAGQAAVGIDNARLFASAQSELDERRHAEALLRASEGRFRGVAETMPGFVWTADADGRLDYTSPNWHTYSGTDPEASQGEGWAAFVHPDDRAQAFERWAGALSSLDPYEVEFRLRRADGVYRWWLARAHASVEPDIGTVRWIGTCTDLDEIVAARETLARSREELEVMVEERLAVQRDLEERLRQSQKMEAVGQLTGGLAHDFNNMLAGISGSLELMQIRLQQGRVGEVDRYIVAAQGAARRAAALTHRLLAFSRRQTLDPKPTDVNRLVVGMEDLVRRTVGPATDIEVVTAGGLWSTLIDPGQLENALLNLCINARDAMPDGGHIVIETGNKWLDERGARERDLEPGQYVSLCVSDNGSGMPPEIIAKAFDPFFTTKPMGQGTGLGLSMIYGFVRQSAGQVRIYSEVGQGTMVCLYLPRHVGTDAEDGGEVIEPADLSQVVHGETVLVVDDEATIRMLVAEVLEDLGYVAIEAGDGASALRILQSDVRIDLLVTDVGLPNGMNGRQLADAAIALRPTLKTLFITGYAENAALSHGHLGTGMQVLTKPFGMDALRSRITDLLS